MENTAAAMLPPVLTLLWEECVHFLVSKGRWREGMMHLLSPVVLYYLCTMREMAPNGFLCLLAMLLLCFDTKLGLCCCAVCDSYFETISNSKTPCTHVYLNSLRACAYEVFQLVFCGLHVA